MCKFCSECGRENVRKRGVDVPADGRWRSAYLGDPMLCPRCGVNSRPVGMELCSECRLAVSRKKWGLLSEMVEKSVPWEGRYGPFTCNRCGMSGRRPGSMHCASCQDTIDKIESQGSLLHQIADALRPLQTDGSPMNWEALSKLARVAMSKAGRVKELESALDRRVFKGTLSQDDFKGRRGMFCCQMLKDWCVEWNVKQERLPHSSLAAECAGEPEEFVRHSSWSGSATLEVSGTPSERALVYLPSDNGAILGGEVVVTKTEGKKVWFVGNGPLLVDGKELG